MQVALESHFGPNYQLKMGRIKTVATAACPSGPGEKLQATSH